MGRPMIPRPMNPTICAMMPPQRWQVWKRKLKPGPVNTHAAASSQGRTTPSSKNASLESTRREHASPRARTSRAAEREASLARPEGARTQAYRMSVEGCGDQRARRSHRRPMNWPRSVMTLSALQGVSSSWVTPRTASFTSTSMCSPRSPPARQPQGGVELRVTRLTLAGARRRRCRRRRPARRTAASRRRRRRPSLVTHVVTSTVAVAVGSVRLHFPALPQRSRASQSRPRRLERRRGRACRSSGRSRPSRTRRRACAPTAPSPSGPWPARPPAASRSARTGTRRRSRCRSAG